MTLDLPLRPGELPQPAAAGKPSRPAPPTPRSFTAAARSTRPAPPTALPLPPDLPARLPNRPRALLLIDADAVSWGLASSPASGRASDLQVRRCLNVAEATARALDPLARTRYAASSKTAAHHLDVLTAAGNGTWSIRRGRDGADRVLLEELDDLIEARLLATRRRRPRSARLADLVILVAADHIYAPAIQQLRLFQVPTWLMVPGRFVAASLYSSSCAVSFLGPQLPLDTSVVESCDPTVPSLPAEAEDHHELPPGVSALERLRSPSPANGIPPSACLVHGQLNADHQRATSPRGPHPVPPRSGHRKRRTGS